MSHYTMGKPENTNIRNNLQISKNQPEQFYTEEQRLLRTK